MVSDRLLHFPPRSDREPIDLDASDLQTVCSCRGVTLGEVKAVMQGRYADRVPRLRRLRAHVTRDPVEKLKIAYKMERGCRMCWKLVSKIMNDTT